MASNYLEQYVLSGGVMMIFLIPTSILAAAWVVQGFIRLRRSRIAPRKLHQAARNIQDAKAAQLFEETLAAHDSPLARLAAHLLRLEVVGNDPRTREKENDYLRPALQEEIDLLWQQTTALATIWVIAPLMGLLGTILGLMDTFREYTTNPDHSIATLGIGINRALVTTMWGFIIAIPTYVFLQILRRKIFHYEKELLPREAKNLAGTVWARAHEIAEEGKGKVEGKSTGAE